MQFFFPANHVEEVSRGGGPELTQQVLHLGGSLRRFSRAFKKNELNISAVGF